METVVAEKAEAIVSLGMLNSRMKDFFDIWFLARIFQFDGRALSNAMRATLGGAGYSSTLMVWLPCWLNSPTTPRSAFNGGRFCGKAALRRLTTSQS
jgi:hypothetical protein